MLFDSITLKKKKTPTTYKAGDRSKPKDSVTHCASKGRDACVQFDSVLYSFGTDFDAAFRSPSLLKHSLVGHSAPSRRSFPEVSGGYSGTLVQLSMQSVCKGPCFLWFRE